MTARIGVGVTSEIPDEALAAAAVDFREKRINLPGAIHLSTTLMEGELGAGKSRECAREEVNSFTVEAV